MEQTRNKQKIKLLYLIEILRKETDETHWLTTAQICQRLGDLGITCERRTVTLDIDLLNECGFKVNRKMVGHEKGYYITDRTFSTPELRLLIDAVLSSKFITEEKSVELMKKLATLTSSPGAEGLRRSIHASGKPKSFNEKGYAIIDAINEAIRIRRKISFYYFDYDNRKRQQRKNDGNPYTVSPYDLIYDGDFYYLTGFCDERGEVRVFRVDRIESQPEITEITAAKPPKTYHVEKYTQEVFRMYATQETTEVKLLCDGSVMKAVIDMFGATVRTHALEDNKFIATVKVCTSPTFFRWVFGWDGQIRIDGPEEIRMDYTDLLAQEISRY